MLVSLGVKPDIWNTLALSTEGKLNQTTGRLTTFKVTGLLRLLWVGFTRANLWICLFFGGCLDTNVCKWWNYSSVRKFCMLLKTHNLVTMQWCQPQRVSIDIYNINSQPCGVCVVNPMCLYLPTRPVWWLCFCKAQRNAINLPSNSFTVPLDTDRNKFVIVWC